MSAQRHVEQSLFPDIKPRVLAGQWSGVVAAQHGPFSWVVIDGIAAQHGPFSWVVIDGINVPQTHATITLRPVENPHAG